MRQFQSAAATEIQGLLAWLHAAKREQIGETCECFDRAVRRRADDRVVVPSGCATGRLVWK